MGRKSSSRDAIRGTSKDTAPVPSKEATAAGKIATAAEITAIKSSCAYSVVAAQAAADAGVAPPAPMYPLPPEDGEPDIAAVSQRSREIAALNRKPKEPQTRTPWSRNDVRMLMKAVDVFKCKWSQIEEEIKAGMIRMEHPRDQQALRDKARLLKQDFLK